MKAIGIFTSLLDHQLKLTVILFLVIGLATVQAQTDAASNTITDIDGNVS